ncbi:transmembrane reductase CYB561D2 [Haematobia irritans]|uniref:transmembrane reductase CYB561D2 n=1 Tax=Haematobia irritans TaxID=7368 RepID=UPI003F506E48
MSAANIKSTGGIKPKQKPAIWPQIQSILNTVNHILIVLIAVFVTLLARNLDFKDTAMHMFLTVIGWHFLAAEALMSHYAYNPITRNLSHRNKSRFHGLLQLAGGLMAIWGSLGKILATEGEHFTTLHGKIGLGATFMSCASLLGGTVNFFQPKFAHKVYTPAEIKYRHNLFGIFGFAIAMCTVFLGYFTKFFTKHVDADVIPAFALATALVFLLTIIGPSTSLIDKMKYRKKAK